MKNPLITGLVTEVGQPTTVNGVQGYIYANDDQGNLVRASAPTAFPTNGSRGYKKGCYYINTAGGAGTSVYVNDGTETSCAFVSITSGGTSDHKVLVTAADTTANYLSNKLGAGTGITLTTTNPAGNEVKTITNDGVIGITTTDFTGLTTNGTAGTVYSMERSITARNAEVGNLVPGDLVYIAGWDDGFGIPKVLKAGADANLATHVVADGTNPVLPGAPAVVYEYTVVTGLNTNAAMVEDPVYLDLSGAAPTWTLTPPSDGSSSVQLVGAVKVVDVAIGEIWFFPGAREVIQVGGNSIASGSIDSSKMEEDVIKIATVNLTKANILVLNSAPTVVIGAPGVGKAIEFISALVYHNEVGAAYTAGGDVTFAYDVAATIVSNTVTAALSFGTAAPGGAFVSANPAPGGVVVAENDGIVIQCAGADFTDNGGTATGTGKIIISYRIYSV